MDKNEIIARLERLARCAIHTVGEPPFVMSLDDGIAVHEAIDIIQRSQQTGQWIPCDERLPEYLDYVLLSSPEYGLKIGARARKSNVNSWYLDEPLDCDVWHVILSNSWYDLEDFTAWMPLPEPYKEEQDG